MNNKIPFHELAAKVAAVTGISPESAGNFIKNFFEIISESLIKGETVKIKGLGTFAVTETDGEKTVKFDLDKELSESVNAPFSIFEPVTLNDEVTDKMLSDVDVEVDNEKHSDESAKEVAEIDTNDETASLEISETAELEQTPSEPEIKEIIADEDTAVEATTSQTSTSSVTPLPEEEPQNISTSISEPIETASENEEAETLPADSSEETSKETSEKDDEPQAASIPAKPTPVITPLEEEPEEFVNTPSEPSKGNFWLGMGLGFIVGLAVGACAVYLAIDRIFNENNTGDIQLTEELAEEIPSETLIQDSLQASSVAADSVATEEAKPATTEPVAEQQAKEAAPAPQQPKTVRDTVKRGYLIHDMAKKFYGSKDFWVYIYEENKSKIGNPNRMQPGDVLIIPSAEKYGIIPGNAESIRRAQAKAGQILAKYPK